MFLMKLKNNFYFLFLIINIYYKINCEDSTNSTASTDSIDSTDSPVCCTENCLQETCEQLGTNCKYFNDHSCLECVNITADKYYYKDGSSCHLLEIKSGNKKVIGETREVIEGNCPGDYKKLGDFCYSSPPGNADVDQNDNSIYKCLYKFYTEEINGFLKYNCLASGVSCSDEGYVEIEGTEQCFKCPSSNNYYELGQNGLVNCYSDHCPNDNQYIKTGNDINRCSSSCNSNEFSYNKTEGSTITLYCKDTCPDEAKYYYKEADQQNNIKANDCLPACNKKHFNSNEDNYVCITSCSNLTTVDLTQKLFICSNEETVDKCPELYQYYYKKGTNNYCLKSCKDTQDNYFKESDSDTPETTYLNYSIKIIDEEEKTVKECLSTNIDSFRIEEISLNFLVF